MPDTVQYIHTIKNGAGLPVSFIAIIGDAPAIFISVSGQYCSKQSGVSIIGSKGMAELHNAYDEIISIRTEAGEEKMKIDNAMPLYLELKEFTEYLYGSNPPRCSLREAWEASSAILNLRKAANL